jgi:orotate phosphoribosyltransferase
VRSVTLSDSGLTLIGREMLELLFVDTVHETRGLIRCPSVDAVGGLTIGADPIVSSILVASNGSGCPLRGFLIRKEPKKHGTGQLIEGPLRPGDHVAIVDDVATSGGSLLRAIDAAEAAGAVVACAVVVLDRLEGAEAALAARGIPLVSLLTILDLGIEPSGAK